MKLLPFLFLLSFACEAQTEFYSHHKQGFETLKNIGGQGTITYLGVVCDSITGDSNGIYYWLKRKCIKHTDYFNKAKRQPKTKQDTTLSAKQLSLEEKLLLYADECWNDSTESEKYERKESYAIHGLDTIVVSFLDRVPTYIHRKPTFEGFIEWLKKK